MATDPGKQEFRERILLVDDEDETPVMSAEREFLRNRREDRDITGRRKLSMIRSGKVALVPDKIHL